MTVEQINRQLQELAHLKDEDPQKAGKIEKLVRMADSIKDADLQYKTRDQLVDAAVYGGYPDKALAAYAWMLQEHDKRAVAGGRYAAMSLLWKYKWVVDRLTSFSYISREQIEAALEDMERRYQTNNFGMEPILRSRISIGRSLGDRAYVEQYLEKLKDTPASWMSDCEACVSESNFQTQLFLGNYEQAMQHIEPVLSGRQKCRSVPDLTYHLLYLPYIERGKTDDALALYHKKRPLDTPDYLLANANTIFLMLAAGKMPSALKIFSRNVGLVFDSNNERAQLNFYRAAGRLFTELSKKQKKSTVKLDLSPRLPFYEQSNEYDIETLRHYFTKEAERLTAAFDARNGNTTNRDRLNRLMEMPLE